MKSGTLALARKSLEGGEKIVDRIEDTLSQVKAEIERSRKLERLIKRMWGKALLHGQSEAAQ